MISTYSTPLIVLEAVKKVEKGVIMLEIIAETTDQKSQSEVPITFYGERAKEAAEKLVRGVKFTYRGVVRTLAGKPLLVGLAFTRIN